MIFMQPEEQSHPWIKDLVHKLKWTYGALWTLNTGESSRPLIGFNEVHEVARWKDGWYNFEFARSTRTLSGNDNIVRNESRIEALFYSSYKSCSFKQGFGYVGFVLLKRQNTWLTGSQEVLEGAIPTQSLFLKTANIQTVMCMPWNNHVLELGKFEQESRNELVLYQIQRWLSCVTNPPLSTQLNAGEPGGVISENNSDGSREAMQMSPSIASSIFTDVSNINVHFGAASSSADLLIKQQQPNNTNQGTSSFSTSLSPSDARVTFPQMPKRNNSLKFVRYPVPPPSQSSAHEVVSLLRDNQRVPSMTAHEKSSLEMGTTFAEDWGAAASVSSGLFQPIVIHDSDSIVSCSGLAIPSRCNLRCISSLLPADTFAQQQHRQIHPSGDAGGGISLDQGLLVSSMPETMPPDIAGPLPVPMDLLQESSADLFGLTPKNSQEWPSLETSKTNSLVQMLQEFTDDDHVQRLHSPDHALIESAVASSSETMGDWAGASTATAPISHQHRHQFDRQQQQEQRAVLQQFEFPHIQNPSIVNNLQPMSTPRPALASLMTPQQQIQHPVPLVPHGQQSQSPRWPITFTTPTAWVRWVARKQAGTLRYKSRDPNGANHAAVRVNQMVLKKLLKEIVPSIAEEQKAREHDAAAQAVETESSSHRVRLRQEFGTIQDPQAKTHMLAERRRRVRENEHYAALRKLIPPTSRMDKATVLAETIHLVKRLRRRVKQLEKGNPDNSGTPNLSLVTSEDSQIPATSQTSRGDPGSPTPAGGAGSSEPEERKPPGPVQAPAGLLQDDKEIVEVNAQACAQNQLRAKIRTFHRPDTVVHILTCLKHFGLEVLCTSIIIEKDWVQADFQLKMNADLSSHISQFTKELQEALRKAVFPVRSSTDSTLEVGSLAQDS